MVAGERPTGSRLARLENQIAEVWANVLGVERVAGEDDFFELGGNSLHAVQIVGITEEIFDVHLSVRAILETRTVRDMAVRVELALQEVL